MPILYAELQVAGRQVACEVASFSFEQPTDEKGRPSSIVRVGLLKVVISGEPAGWSIWEEIKFNPYRRESGHLVFFKNEGITAKRYTFYDAALVWLEFRHNGKGTTDRRSATQVELHFSAATIELDGIRLEAHSLIPWETDAQTSFRALTKPAAPLPSAHLAVGAVAAAKLRAEQAATGLVKKVITPGGAIGTEIGGVSAGAIGRVAGLLPGLLLMSTNSPDDPGYASEWEMYRRNHHPAAPIPPPPKPDEVRLAELERALAAQTLTAQEEAELIVLLAKVKGIHIQRLDELSPPTRKPPSRRPKNPEEPLLTNDGEVSQYGKWYYQRPYKFHKGVRDKVWDAAAKKDVQGRVFDPLDSTEMDPGEVWDMGHKPGYEFRKHQKSAAQRSIPREQFIKEHNEHTHYQPELPASNRGHAGEMTTDDYFGH